MTSVKYKNKYARALKTFNNELNPDITQQGNPVPKELPNVTASDEGKVLGVNSEGKWAPKVEAKELPDVTTSDEGKVLAVNSEGKWAPTQPSGGEESALFLTITATFEDDTPVFTANKSYDEIKAAYDSGKEILCRFVMSEDMTEMDAGWSSNIKWQYNDGASRFKVGLTDFAHHGDKLSINYIRMYIKKDNTCEIFDSALADVDVSTP